MTDSQTLARRRFMKRALGVLAGVPLLAGQGCAVSGGAGPREQPLQPGELPVLNPSETAPAALGYKADASRVEDFFDRNAGEFCHTCANFSQIGEGAQWGTCTVFPGRRVNVDGWCKRWTSADA